MRSSAKRVLINGALVAAAAAVALVLVEVGVRFFAPQPRYYLPQHLFTADAELGYVLTPGFRGRMHTPENSTAIAINEEGFRGLSPEGEPSATIVGVGDSFTFGTGVEAEDTFLERLRVLLSGGRRGGVDVRNLGVPGYGTDQEYLALRRSYARLAPDLVVVGFYINDVMDSVTPDFTVADGYLVPSEKTIAAFKGKGVTWKQRLGMVIDRLEITRFVFNRLSASPRFREVFLGLVQRSKGRAGNRLDLYARETAPALEQAWSATLRYLGSIRDLVAGAGGRLLVVYIPERQQVYAEQWRKVLEQQGVDEGSYDALKPQQALAAFCAGEGIPHLDLTEAFRRRVAGGEDLYFTMDPHLNAKGHAAAAGLIHEKITADGLLPR